MKQILQLAAAAVVTVVLLGVVMVRRGAVSVDELLMLSTWRDALFGVR